MNDDQLIALLAALLAIGTDREPEDFFQNAAYLASAAKRFVADSKLTTRLKIDYAVATEPETRGGTL